MLNRTTYSASAVVSDTPGMASAMAGSRIRRATPVSRKVFLRPISVLMWPATIALQYAAAFPSAVAAVIVLAPHLFVEPVARARIAQLRDRWADDRLRTRLAQLHDDPDGVFKGWSGCWLDPAFAHWRISTLLVSIACPALAIQGTLDQYGTLEQLADPQRYVPQAELLALKGCRHVPHEDHPEVVLEAVVR
jgi:pimeloyl-ACP methyl ester carboxylesterase